MISKEETRELLTAKKGDTAIVNKSMTCVFTSTGRFAFGKFEKDSASPSHTAAADVVVSDNGNAMDGKMYLTCHNDLENSYSCVVVRNGVMTDVTNIRPEKLTVIKQ